MDEGRVIKFLWERLYTNFENAALMSELYAKIWNNYNKGLPLEFDISWLKDEQAASCPTYQFEMGQWLLEHPERLIFLLNVAYEKLINHDVSDDKHISLSPSTIIRLIGFKDDPYLLHMGQKNPHRKRISELRAVDENKLWVLEGTVKSMGAITHKIIQRTFSCRDCGKEVVSQLYEGELQKPGKCACASTRWKVLKDLDIKIDEMTLRVEETYDEAKGERLDSIYVHFEGDILRPEFVEKIGQGNRVIVIGVYKDKIKGESMVSYIEGNNLILMADKELEIAITEEDKAKLDGIKHSVGLVKYFSTALYQQIYGEQNIKESLIIQMVGNPQASAGMKKTRGDIHVLLIGDSGSAKSTFLVLTKDYAVKCRYVSGGSASGVGITASVQKDELTGSFVVEAGAFPIAHNGICAIDEADKLGKDEIGKLHEALEQQQVSVDKANVHTTLQAKTRLLAAANPKHGNFDINGDLVSQLNFPPPFLNRFDLIWPILDFPEEGRDAEIGKVIICNIGGKCATEPIELFKKYQVQVKNLKVTLPNELAEKLVAWYTKTRRTMNLNGVKVRFNPRSLESIMRLTMAHARAELKALADDDDLQWALNIYMESMKLVATDSLNVIDVGKISTGVSHKERELLTLIPEVLKTSPDPMDEQALKDKLDPSITDAAFQKALELLHKKGDVIEPRRGFWLAA